MLPILPHGVRCWVTVKFTLKVLQTLPKSGINNMRYPAISFSFFFSEW